MVIAAWNGDRASEDVAEEDDEDHREEHAAEDDVGLALAPDEVAARRVVLRRSVPRRNDPVTGMGRDGHAFVSDATAGGVSPGREFLASAGGVNGAEHLVEARVLEPHLVDRGRQVPRAGSPPRRG